MSEPELLHHLRGAGLVLTLTHDGGLHVAPRAALTDDHRAAIRAERDSLVLALQAEHDADAEAFEERAAIMEFDGRLPRADAEAAARQCVDCAHLTRRRTCLEPEAAGLIPAGQGFGIAWPGPVQAATCPAFTIKPPRTAP